MNSFSSFLKYGLSASDVEELKSRAREELGKVKVTSSSPEFVLDGALVEVISETENVGYNEGTIDYYYLTQVVRNGAGEYFLLKTTDKSPFVKHLPQASAKAILKGKYQVPNGREGNGDA